jgi:biotin synthesis protein BioG
MKYKWLNKKNNKKLIIFFNGWGMDESIVKHLECEDFDILMFYDYNSLDNDFDWDSLDSYQEKNLVTWSMGVMVSSLIQPLIRHFVTPSPSRCVGKAVAINGTLKPIDADYGIHPRVYNLTIKGFSEEGREKFISSMFDIQPPTLLSSLKREINEQCSELVALKNYRANTNFKYDKVLISDNDKIIPTKSQVNFWEIEPNLKGGHCPFFQFKKWSELL